MKRLKIAILGCRGIPNHYGGFEQLAQHLSFGLSDLGHSVTVYNSHNHPYQESKWKGVNIVHRFDAEYLVGIAGQFVYDFNCIRHARKQDYDVWLLLGYNSSSVWGWLYPKKTVRISNMDGLEWKREKYNRLTKRFLLFAEKLAIHYSHYFIADSTVIQSYLQHKYPINAKYIPYGANIVKQESQCLLNQLELSGSGYSLLISRMEPENNVEMIVKGFSSSNSKDKLVVVGNICNSLGRRIVREYQQDHRIRFTGAIFDPIQLHTLKKNCTFYFHGHSVGGTNPSLLEAMASGAVICAHDNPFNRAVLEDNGLYFSSPHCIKHIVEDVAINGKEHQMVKNNLVKINASFNWSAIVAQYESFIRECHQSFHQ